MFPAHFHIIPPNLVSANHIAKLMLTWKIWVNKFIVETKVILDILARYEEADPALKLSEELEGSLRTLKVITEF